MLVTKGVLRVAAGSRGRAGRPPEPLTDGRLAVARMIGGGLDAREAHLGLIELANASADRVDPTVRRCPLRAMLREARWSTGNAA